jgi:single-stranded-DNA-specific exonuclease
MYPIKTVVTRKIDKAIYEDALGSGYGELESKIIAGRMNIESDDIKAVVAKISDIPKIGDLPDLEKASKRIIEAIKNREKIALLCDFDVDGTSSAAILYKCLTSYLGAKPNNVSILISNRLKEGYGFSDGVLDRILNSGTNYSLLITADQGSSDNERISKYKKEMKNRGFSGDVIVTDHHEIPADGGPKKALAFVNPMRSDSLYADPTICGAVVAFFLMVSVERHLGLNGLVRKEMDICTAATIADCVNLSKITNRSIVKAGLIEINKGLKPSWGAMKGLQWNKNEPIRSESIAFGLGPRINACSRIGGDGLVAVKYFLSDRDEEAIRYLNILGENNEKRKKEEKKMLKSALKIALIQEKKKNVIFNIVLDDGNHGIHGIVASRIMDKFGKPVIVYSPKDGDIYSGSARSIPGVDIRKLMEDVNSENNLLLSFGGHTAAAGLGINKNDIDEFAKKMNDLCESKFDTKKFVPYVNVDGNLPDVIDMDVFNKIIKLEPYGRGFEYPKFYGEPIVRGYKVIGKTKDTVKLMLEHNKQRIDGIWFKVEKKDINSIEIGGKLSGVYEIRDNYGTDGHKTCLTLDCVV